MKTFFNILQTITNKKHKTFPDELFKVYKLADLDIYTDEIANIDFLISKSFYKEKSSRYLDKNMRNSEAKFSSLNSILENTFYKNELKEKIFNIFSKAQRCYYAFSRLSRIYKTKKYPIVVSNDLMLNPLDINHNNTFILIENKSKYLFSLNDLVSIIETAISNSPNFFSDPLSPLNPYNNEKITTSTLYNIYFKLKESRRLMSILFHLFFLEHFNKEEFSEKNEPIIRENSIKKYVFNSPYTTLYPYILTMLRNNPYTKKYKIHKDFPKDILVEIFRPFLFYFYIINYDIKNTSKIYNYKDILYIKLKKFYEYNNAFGRKYVKLIKHVDKVIKREYKFNTEHISFYKIPIKNETIHQAELFIFGTSTINILINNSIFNAVEDDEDDEDDEDVEDDDEDDEDDDDEDDDDEDDEDAEDEDEDEDDEDEDDEDDDEEDDDDDGNWNDVSSEDEQDADNADNNIENNVINQINDQNQSATIEYNDDDSDSDSIS